MDDETRFTIAIEIASAAISNAPQEKIPADKPEALGEWAGKIFKAVLKEIGASKPDKPTTASKTQRF